MPKRSALLAALLATLTLASGARAQDTGGVNTHDGFYLRLGIGPGFVSGGVEATELAQPPDVSVTGFGIASELAVGGTVIPGLVIGGGSYGAAIFAPSYENGGTFEGGLLTLSTIGPFADYYLDPNEGLHFQAAILFAVVNQAKGEDGEPNQLTEDTSGDGFGLMLGAGYEFWIADEWSVGALARITYIDASLEGEDTELEYDFNALVPALLATFTYH